MIPSLTKPPPLARAQILWSENGSVPERSFRSLAAADAALADAFATEPPPKGGAYDKTAFELVWTDGRKHEGRADVTEDDVRTAPAAGGILRQHLTHVGRWYRDQSATAEWWTPDDQAEHAAWGVELLRRLDAEPPLGTHRNADTPRVARVRILWSENRAVPVRSFHSLAGADAALDTAFTKAPPPEGGGYDKLAFVVEWTDGQKHEGRADVRRIDLHTAPEVGGILRQHLDYVGRWLRDQSATSPLWTSEEAAERRAWGEELLRRLDREPTFGTIGRSRNLASIPEDQLLPIGVNSEHLDVSLLPDPTAAAAELEAHFAAVRPSVSVWMGHGRTVPRTTNRDVRYAANWISLALASDMPRLRSMTGKPQGRLWDRWARTVDHVRRHLDEDPDLAYRDSVRFWNDQVPALARQMSEALHGNRTRNARRLQVAAHTLGFWPTVQSVARLGGNTWRAA